MKINTKTVLKDFKEESYKQNGKELTIGGCLADILARVKSKDPLKSFILARNFYKNEEINLTSEDIVFLKEIIKDSDYLPYIQGQIIEIIEN